jgi:P-type Ca2+ transporter type 2C
MSGQGHVVSTKPTADSGAAGRAGAAHSISVRDALVLLESSAAGLSQHVAARRLATVGPNALRPPRTRSAFRIVADQASSIVVGLLFVASVIAYLIGDPIDAAAILTVLAINIGLGATTELRARRAMDALLRLDVPSAQVVRDGVVAEIDARDLVPGDVVVLEAGSSVPADARLIAAAELRTNEAALTGESLPVGKRIDVVLDADTPLADRRNMVYKATTVAAGTGRGVVTATGMRTEVGRIGVLVGGVRDERTPLERRLDALGRRLVWVALAAAAAVVAAGVLRGLPWPIMLETGIALAIAAVPEGLPAVITIALAVGIHRMARRRALVRRLPAVEALGSATIICTDKTGTLTAGEQTVTELRVAGHEVRFTGTGYAPEGSAIVDGQPFDAGVHAAVAQALRIGALANDANLHQDDGAWTAIGDPTDAALLVAAHKAGFERDALRAQWPLEGEIPFSSERQLMATFHRRDGALTALVKGAPGRVLTLCTRVLDGGEERALDDEGRAALLAENAGLARRGLRVLALAIGTVERADERALDDLVFVGFVGMIDPPSPGVKETVAGFRAAGIRTVMLTGDQRLTAEAIARELGVLAADDRVVEGRELESAAAAELPALISNAGAFSRVSPEAKLRLVDAFQAQGDVVAMLGDGVNDAAALKKADVGVAMGRRGTDVAKEAADVVLSDDRFQTIGAAIEEGRVIYDNIRKFVFYLFSCNLAEVLTLLAAAVAGLPVPLTPLQLLWLNIVTDTFPALSLALEPAEPDIMRRPPRDPHAAILSRRFIRSVAMYAVLITAATLAAFLYALATGGAERAVTFAFMTLALAQLFHLGNARSPRPLLGARRALANHWAVGAVVIVVAFQLLATYLTPLAELLDVTPLTPADWIPIALLAAAPAVFGQAVRLRATRRSTIAHD